MVGCRHGDARLIEVGLWVEHRLELQELLLDVRRVVAPPDIVGAGRGADVQCGRAAWRYCVSDGKMHLIRAVRKSKCSDLGPHVGKRCVLRYTRTAE